ncbi:MAG: hypothetical protein M1816_007744 [Peltula sp. TS41687]|nr:MAG: hypothetical protein M1816_007744 [Peltula sp. TS41687]
MDQPNFLRQVYSATYSNNPVFEYHVEGNQIMRRRADDWVNATHILKLVGFDKPARTRILEREVQKGHHEKIQGGYGKYQGTWVPLDVGRALAERNNVLDKLLPIFDYVPGNNSPPPAPKQTIATSSRPRAPRGTGAARRRASSTVASTNQIVNKHADHGQVRSSQVLASQIPTRPTATGQNVANHYNNIDSHMQIADVNTPQGSAALSYDDEEVLDSSQGSNALQRRAFELEPPLSESEVDIVVYKDQLQDYCLTFFKSGPNADVSPPPPPPGSYPDMAITKCGHTGLHLAAGFGAVELMKDFIGRGASIVALSHEGETPLIYAGSFTNTYEMGTMDAVIHLLRDTVWLADHKGQTVFHRVALLTSEPHQVGAARSYIDTIISDMLESNTAAQVASLLDMQDREGNTALIIAARYGAKKVVKALVAHGASSHIENLIGDTADTYLLLHRPKKRTRLEITSSSPVLEDLDTVSRSKRARREAAPQTPEYRSTAAMAVSTKLVPMLMAKCAQLAAAYEDELLGKVEGWAAARPFRHGLEEDLTRYSQELVAVQFEAEKEAARDAQEEEELRGLEAQYAALLEQEDNYHLHVAKQRSELQNGASMLQNGSSQSSGEDQEVLTKTLIQALSTRREMVGKLVKAESVAQEKVIYRKLVERALEKDEARKEGGEKKVQGEILVGVLHNLELITQRNGVLVL